MEKLPEYQMVQSDDNYGPGLLKLKFCLKTGIPQASDEDRPIGHNEITGTIDHNQDTDSQQMNQSGSSSQPCEDKCGIQDKSSDSFLDYQQMNKRQKRQTLQQGHRKRKTYTCEECGTMFTSHKAIETHSYVHTGERPFVCSKCGKAFKRAVHLRDHETLHSGEKRFVCTECGKAFTVNSSLKVHMLTHTGEKPHMCSQCGRCFTRSSDMHKHLRTHSGVRPFVCSHCGKMFARNQHLESHIDTQHHNVKRYTCNECNKSFYRIQQLEIHMCSHTGQKPCLCYICGKGFPVNAALDEHLKTHSNDSKTREQLKEKSYKRRRKDKKVKNSRQSSIKSINSNSSIESEIEFLLSSTLETDTLSHHDNVATDVQSLAGFEPQKLETDQFPSVNLEPDEMVLEKFKETLIDNNNVTSPIHDMDSDRTSHVNRNEITSSMNEDHSLSMVPTADVVTFSTVFDPDSFSKESSNSNDCFNVSSAGLIQLSDYIAFGTGFGALST